MRGRNVGADAHHRQNVTFLQGDPGDRVALDFFVRLAFWKNRMYSMRQSPPPRDMLRRCGTRAGGSSDGAQVDVGVGDGAAGRLRRR